MGQRDEAFWFLQDSRSAIDVDRHVQDRIGRLALDIGKIVMERDIGLLVLLRPFIAYPGSYRVFGCRTDHPGILDGTDRNAVGNTGIAPVGGTGLGIDRIVIYQYLHQVGIAARYVGIEQCRDHVGGFGRYGLRTGVGRSYRCLAVKEFDTGNGMRLGVVAVIEERSLGTRHLET